jgi:hypothetical protein
MFASSVIIMGDINIHLDVSQPSLVKFRDILESHDLVQHVTSSTQLASHVLDVLISRTDSKVVC